MSTIFAGHYRLGETRWWAGGWHYWRLQWRWLSSRGDWLRLRSWLRRRFAGVQHPVIRALR